MLMRPAHRRRNELGSALIAAIALMIIGSFVATAIYMSARSSADGSRQQLESQAAEQLVRDAGTMLASVYSSNESGEFDGFVPSRAALQRYVQTVAGGRVLDNQSREIPAGLRTVDSRRITDLDQRVTVAQPIDGTAAGGRTGYWQILSARLPSWQTTRGARVAVWIRAWTGSNGAYSKAQVYRLTFRPEWFGDYQMLVDGPIMFGPTTRLNGRVHSNGYRTSFYNSYDTQYDSPSNLAIQFMPGARCVGNAQVSTSAKNIGGAGIGGCPAANRISSRVPRINLLRAQDLITRLQAMCYPRQQPVPGISLYCSNTSAPITVQLRGSQVIANGSSRTARYSSDVPGTVQGAVIVAQGDVRLHGTLSGNSRALVIAAARPGATFSGSGSAPSIWVTAGPAVGVAANSPGASFGAVAEGDVIFDETRACPLQARGAFMSISGLMSMHPDWRSVFPTPGGRPCNGPLNVEGSIVGHYPPAMISGNNSGYHGSRTYSYLGSLYDNPPPLFPTSQDWSVLDMSIADLDCFTGVTLNTSSTSPRCLA